jgi:hypothetical protein
MNNVILHELMMVFKCTQHGNFYLLEIANNLVKHNEENHFNGTVSCLVMKLFFILRREVIRNLFANMLIWAWETFIL